MGGAGAQVAGRPVGRVAQRLDRALHPLEGVGAQQVGAVEGVGDRLATDPGALGDGGQRRPGTAGTGVPAYRRRRSATCSAPLDRSNHWAQLRTARRCRCPRLACLPMSRAQRRRPVHSAPSAAGRPASGSAAAASARRGARVAEVGAAADGPRATAAPGHHARRCRSARCRVEDVRRPRPSGVAELDRVLGGGLVPGAVDPAGRRARRRQVARCCSRSPPDRARAAAAPSTSPARSPPPRCGCAPTAPAASTTSSTSPPRPTSAPCSATSSRCARPCWSSTRCRPSAPPGSTGVPGGVTQVKEVAAALVRVAKTRGMATVLVGHVTKDGAIAGPRVLEHLVDVVLHFEGDRALPAAHGPRGQEPLRPRRRGRLLRPLQPTASSRSPTRPACSSPATTSPVPGTCVTVTARGPPAAARRGAGAGRPLAARASAAHHLGRRLRPRRHGARGARAAGSRSAARPRRLRLDRRRRPADRAGGRPGDRAGHRAAPPRLPTCPRGLVAIGEIGLAGELRRVRDLPSGGWPRRPRSASSSRWCRGAEPRLRSAADASTGSEVDRRSRPAHGAAGRAARPAPCHVP